MAYLALIYIFLAAGTYFVTRSAMPVRFATLAAAYVTGSGVVSWAFAFYNLVGEYRTRSAWHHAISALYGSGNGVMVLGFDLASWHLAAPVAAVVTACATLVSWVYLLALMRISSRRTLAIVLRQPTDLRAAREAWDAIQHPRRVKRKSAEERKVARLNAAAAAVTRFAGDDAPNGLIQATDELCDLLDDPPEDWLVWLAAALDLVDAMSVKAERHGDLTGYPAALDRLDDAARHAPADAGALAIAYGARAQYHAAIADRLGPAADEHAAEAVALMRAAIAAITPYSRKLSPVLNARLGLFMARARTQPGDMEEAIAYGRKAVRLAGRSPRARAVPEQVLATLLIDWASDTAAGLPADVADTVVSATGSAAHGALAEAERLLRRARWHGGADVRGDILQLRAELQSARSAIFGGPEIDRRAAQAWQALARAAVDSDPMERVRIGREWVAWAESASGATASDATWCADAYEYLMSAVPPAVAMRYLTGERDRVLADVQSAAEEAGYWLVRAGRIVQATIALERGRAVSMSEVLGRDRPDLTLALTGMDRLDLLERYRAAVEAYDAAAAPTPDKGLSSAAQRAWATYHAVSREVAEATGIYLPDVPLARSELAAAAREGPVVYLAAAARGGYAVVVPVSGEPTCRPLPGMARAEVTKRVESFLRRGDSDRSGRSAPAEVAAVCRWLWEAGISALARDLPAGALVTIVPVGLLSLLPVHAAGGPAEPGQPPQDWTFLADSVTVRYAHNVRMLLRARNQARSIRPSALTLLAVAAPEVDGCVSLPHAVTEVSQIARHWARVDAVTDGAATAVQGMLAGHSVWHFACHCEAFPENVLDSALALAGAPLTLRAILALPPAPRRLAVLSACQTHLSGTELPDEAMGLPAGLLHAGFAGVIASHWKTSDRSATCLMTRFHEMWRRQGLPPAAALAEAQRWLRTATNTDLRGYLREEPGQPVGRSPRNPAPPGGIRPFRHPYHWAPFALTGY